MAWVDARPALRVHVLGPELRVLRHGYALTKSIAPKTKELLAYLVVNADAPVSRDRVAAALWPDVLDADARTNVRRHLMLLTRYLCDDGSPSPVVSEGEVLGWDASRAWADVHEFVRLARTPGAAAAAIDVYEGDLLASFDAEWLEPDRERLRAEALRLLVKLTDAAERFADRAAATRFAAKTLQLDPYREEALRRLMNYAVVKGDRAAAIAMYRRFERRLRFELDVEPMPETRALVDLLEAGSDGARRPSGTSEDGFVGRVREMTRLAEFVGGSRIVTITGPGGIGKSRFAGRFVRGVAEDYPDGVHIARLNAISPGMSALGAVISELGLVQAGDESMTRSLVAFVGEKQMLLVLDGCENHTREVRALVEILLERTANLRIVATSREQLRVAGETILALPPLSIAVGATDRHGMLDSEAAELFVARARAAAPIPELTSADVRAVEAICAKVDGIPLAIELAAARCRVLGIVEIAKRLADLALIFDYRHDGETGRQRTIREMIAWAYDGLQPTHKAGLRAMALFRSPVTIDEIEIVCAGILDASPIDLVTNLVECSLLLVEYHGPAVSYRILEPIRDFALLEIQRHGESTDVMRRHMRLHCGEALRLGLPEGGSDPGKAFDRVETTYRNVHEVIERAIELDAVDAEVIDLATRLDLFWRERGYAREGYALLRRLCERMPVENAPEAIPLLLAASGLARVIGVHAEARNHATRVERLAEVAGDRMGYAFASFELGAIDYNTGELETARAAFERSFEAFSSLAASAQAARARVDIGLIDMQLGNYDEAAATLREAVDVLASSTFRRWEMFARSALGFAERFRGNFDEASAHSRAVLAFAEGIRDRALATTSLANLSYIASARNDESGVREFVREGLRSVRSGSNPYALLHFMEVAARYFFTLQRYDESARLTAIANVLEGRFEIIPPLEDARIIREREERLARVLGQLAVEGMHRNFGAASTETCVDAALDVIADMDSVPARNYEPGEQPLSRERA